MVTNRIHLAAARWISGYTRAVAVAFAADEINSPLCGRDGKMMRVHFILSQGVVAFTFLAAASHCQIFCPLN